MKIPWFHKKKKQLPYQAELKNEDVEAEIDFYSPTWRFIEKLLKSKLDDARKLNDSPNHDEIKTANIRGKIRVYKNLLALNKSAGNTAIIPKPTY